MDKDTLKELRSSLLQMSQGMQEAGIAMHRIVKVFEKMQELERQLGIEREVLDFEK